MGRGRVDCHSGYHYECDRYQGYIEWEEDCDDCDESMITIQHYGIW